MVRIDASFMSGFVVLAHSFVPGKSAGKSRIALIRKILVSAYHMLNRKQTYHWVEAELYPKKLEELQKKIRKLELLDEKDKKPA
jgi:uncharacterized protein YutE (UPF0331/DUF86 family)